MHNWVFSKSIFCHPNIHFCFLTSPFKCTLFQGALVEAVKDGSWMLLDEINLASAETLQCLSSLLEGPQESFLLPERA